MRQLLALLPLLVCPLMMLGMFVYMRSGRRNTAAGMREEPALHPLNQDAAGPRTDSADAHRSR